MAAPAGTDVEVVVCVPDTQTNFTESPTTAFVMLEGENVNPPPCPTFTINVVLNPFTMKILIKSSVVIIDFMMFYYI